MTNILPVGTVVVKISGKPFKSKLKKATIKSIGKNPITEQDCYFFEEDDSFVNCVMCKEYNETPKTI